MIFLKTNKLNHVIFDKISTQKIALTLNPAKETNAKKSFIIPTIIYSNNYYRSSFVPLLYVLILFMSSVFFKKIQNTNGIALQPRHCTISKSC